MSAIHYRCSRCNADPGRACLTPSGAIRKAHGSREAIVDRAANDSDDDAHERPTLPAPPIAYELGACGRAWPCVCCAGAS